MSQRKQNESLHETNDNQNARRKRSKLESFFVCLDFIRTIHLLGEIVIIFVYGLFRALNLPISFVWPFARRPNILADIFS